MLATYRDSLRELNQGDLGLLEMRLETRLTVLAEKLETSLVKKKSDLEITSINNHLETVKWMFAFFAANVVWTVTVAVLLAGALRR